MNIARERLPRRAEQYARNQRPVKLSRNRFGLIERRMKIHDATLEFIGLVNFNNGSSVSTFASLRTIVRREKVTWWRNRKLHRPALQERHEVA